MTDPELNKRWAKALLGFHSVHEYLVHKGLISEDEMRLTIQKRQEAAKALHDAGVSYAKIGEHFGVSKIQAQRDVKGRRDKGCGTKGTKNGTKGTVNAGCDAPEFPDPEEPDMSDSQIAAFHFRYCAAGAKDHAVVARMEMPKINREDITDKEIRDARNTAKLWNRLANELTKRTKEKADGTKTKTAETADASNEATLG